MSPWDSLAKLFQDNPVPRPCALRYGTAGFRGDAAMIAPIACRMAALMAVRALTVHTQRPGAVAVVTGICITASHNPAPDNGLKLIDANGEMLPPAWEAVASRVMQSDAAAIDEFRQMLASIGVEESKMSACYVAIGRDTRPSGLYVQDLCEQALQAIGAHCLKMGLVTTPEMHSYIERLYFEGGIPHVCGTNGYAECLAASFSRAYERCASREKWTVLVDCSNGVGALRLDALRASLAHLLEIHLFNTDVNDPAKLNSYCGSDFIMENGSWPCCMLEWSQLRGVSAAKTLFVSIDGDADRIICGVVHAGRAHTLSGDYIQTLFALLMQRLLRDAGLPYNVSVVQTPYANGGATNFLRNTLKIPVKTVPTGLKHCQRAARQGDVAIYFEHNGHGSIQFSPEARRDFADHELLSSLAGMLSQTCGDAIVNMLTVVCALAHLGISPLEWRFLYSERHAATYRVSMDAEMLGCMRTDALQTEVLEPTGVQSCCEAATCAVLKVLSVERYSVRFFVRPSGTEPVLRVYVESPSADITLQTSQAIQEALSKFYRK